MLILHIGRHKTGTSSIQHFLHHNREELKRHGVSYPEPFDAVAAHHGLALALSEGRDIEPYLGILRSLQPRDHTVLLSSEGFQRLSPAEANRLTAAFPTTAVVYLREQFSYAWSAYVQRVFGGTESRLFTDSIKSAKYYKFLSGWSEACGGNLSVRVYDRKKLVEGDVVADFCQHALGLDKNLFCPVQTVNESLGWRAVNFVRRLNEITAQESGIPKLKRQTTRALREVTDKFPALMERPIFDAAFREQFQSRFMRNNQRVAAQFFHSDQPLFDLSWRGDSEWNPREGLTLDHLDALYQARAPLKQHHVALAACVQPEP